MKKSINFNPPSRNWTTFSAKVLPQVFGIRRPPIQIERIHEDDLPPFQAHEQEKKLLERKGLFIDRAFHLYAIMRRAFTESVKLIKSSFSVALI